MQTMKEKRKGDYLPENMTLLFCDLANALKDLLCA